MARKVGLDRDQVIDAAAELADREGLQNLSLARVAGVLGVSSPSLYSHVDGLAGLHRALAVEASARLDTEVRKAADGRTGVEALTSIGHAYRRFARSHPGLYATLHTTPSVEVDPEVFAAFRALVSTMAAVLADLGLPDAEAVPLIRTLRSAWHGFVSLEASGGFGLPAEVDESFDVLIEVMVLGMLARHGRRPPA